MKIRRIKYIMFNYIIAVLEFINVFYIWSPSIHWLEKNYVDLDIYTYGKISAYMRYPILFLLLIFIAYKGKFIVFKKKERKRNLISVAMILISVLWLAFMKAASLSIWMDRYAEIMLNWEMHNYINIGFMIISCVGCSLYIIFRRNKV